MLRASWQRVGVVPEPGWKVRKQQKLQQAKTLM